MIDDNAGNYFFLNDILGRAEEIPSYDTESGRTAYEVIRIIGGKPLFLEDHLQRMADSLSAAGFRIFSDVCAHESNGYEVCATEEAKAVFEGKIKEEIRELARIHLLENFNVKLVIYPYQDSSLFPGIAGKSGDNNNNDNNNKTGSRSPDSQLNRHFNRKLNSQLNRLIYIKKSHYPSPEEYTAGVFARTAVIERTEPNAKIERADYKLKVARAFSEYPGVYEILLADRRKYVTEGSKSNLFAAICDRIVTAPGESVLKGITRKYILEACVRCGIPVEEKLMSINDLYRAEGVFISGTSIKVLPVSRVDDIYYNSSKNKSINAVGEEYNNIIRQYLDRS